MSVYSYLRHELPLQPLQQQYAKSAGYSCGDSNPLLSASFFEGSGGRPAEYSTSDSNCGGGSADVKRSKRPYREPQPLSDKQRHMLEQGGKFRWRGTRYASAAEAACAELMERYIAGFKIESGKTFQIIVKDREKGTCKTVDFLVKNTFVEFHPPNRYARRDMPQGDFTGQDLPAPWLNQRWGAGAPIAERELQDALGKQVMHDYQRLRRQVIAMDPRYRGKKLIVVVSAGDLYDKIIEHYGRGYPDRERFIAEFERIRVKVLRENGYARRQPSDAAEA
jgi:hypothetical protein